MERYQELSGVKGRSFKAFARLDRVIDSSKVQRIKKQQHKKKTKKKKTSMLKEEAAFCSVTLVLAIRVCREIITL